MNVGEVHLRVLVAIANYGSKNIECVKRLITEYRSMSFEVDIVVLCEAPKSYGSDVTELVGLPTKNPRSLPFSHKKFFVERAAHYDLFIYTEDDMLIREDNIRAFMHASEILPDDLLPGFIRYEVYPDGRRNYPDFFGPFHWVPGSVASFGEYVYADFSNDHSACYMLTRQQLQRAIRSGGFLVAPHSGRYTLACSAATDPYTQCGFNRIICVSHLELFELHHLTNAYLNRLGVNEDDHRLQVRALLDVLQGKLSKHELLATEKPITSNWDKHYYEPCRTDLLEHIPSEAVKILSVGCGSGTTEAHLMTAGKEVTALPLDSVIGRLVERVGVRLLPPDFSEAFELLGDERFDAIVLGDILQHLKKPVDILSRLGRHLEPLGVIVGSVPNLGPVRRISARLVMRNHNMFMRNHKWESVGRGFADTALQVTSSRSTRKWLQESGLRLVDMRFDGCSAILRRLGPVLPGDLIAPSIVFVARRSKG